MDRRSSCTGSVEGEGAVEGEREGAVEGEGAVGGGNEGQ